MISVEKSSPVDQTAMPKRRSRRNLLQLAAIFIVGALAIGVLGTRDSLLSLTPHVLGIRFEIASACLGIWLGILIWSWARWRGKFDLFEPPTWISLNLYFQVVANVWLLQREDLPPVSWLLEDPRMYPVAVVLFGVGLTALWLGYALVFKSLTKKKAFQSAPPRIPRLEVVALVWVMGTVVTIASTLSGTSTYLGQNVGSTLSNYLYFVEIVTKAAAAVLIINHIRHPSAAGRWWLVAVVLLSIGLGLFSGSKVFLLDLLWLIMLIYYAGGKLPVRWLTVLLIAGIFLVPVVNTYRILLSGIDVGSGVGMSGRVQALSEAFGSSVTQPIGSAVDTSRDTFERRQGSLMHLTASALYLHPLYRPFVGAQMVEYLIPQLVPRVFWPTKPSPPESLQLTTTIYYGAPFETSQSTLGQFADSYRAGGWAWMVIWFLAVGAFSAWLYAQGPYRGSFPGTVFYATVLSQILRYDKEMLLIIVQLLQFAILLWAAINWGMFRPSRPLRTTAVLHPDPSSSRSPLETS